MSTRQPQCTVVYESMFDNTANIARAVARGLVLGGMAVTVVDVADAPPVDALDGDLVVIGAPTHAFSLSRQRTREDAVRQGAAPNRAGPGVREWLASSRSSSGRTASAAVFDTRVRKVRHLKGASTRIRRTMEHLGFEMALPPTGFLVEDVQGPIVDGEVDRALAWGRDLAAASTRSVSLPTRD